MIIKPDWPAPSSIHALTTTRQSGVSRGVYAYFNVATHVSDEPEHVARNRELLREENNLPGEPLWLQQTHSTIVIDAAEHFDGIEADACFTQQANTICTVMTADCLPVLICAHDGSEVAAVHAGWRGLAAGIIEKTIERMQSSPEDLLVWLGPAIGPKHFQVQQDVVSAFTQQNPDALNCFTQQSDTHWLADMVGLTQQRLAPLGIKHLYGGDLCTYTDAEKFYSHRRDGTTGRIASLIWLTKSGQ